jgi:Fe-S cluster assembly protein SufD
VPRSTSFVDERRRAALEVYEREPVPTWRRSGFWTTSVRKLTLEELEPRRYQPVDELPEIVREHLGDEEHAALIVQRGASVVFAHVADPRIVVTPLEQAVQQSPRLVEPYFARRLPHDEGKFQAATAAFWTGGAFVHVPNEVRVERPIQIVWLIDEPGTAQYARTLAVVGEHAVCRLREYFLATDLDGQALHAGGFELYALPGSHVDLAHYQDWGSGEVYDVSTRRVEIRRDARVKWVPIHLGGRMTKQTLDIITAERGSDMRHTGLYFTERDEHLDLFTTDKHEEGYTTGDTVWKGALTGDSRASYEGLIHIVPGAQETDTYLQTHQMLLSPRAKGDAIPSLIVETDNVRASHGGTVGELDQDQVFYMMTRGLSRAQAVRVLVEGYFEEVVQRLEDPGLEQLVRRRVAEKLLGAEEQVRDFIGERAEAAEPGRARGAVAAGPRGSVEP